MNPPLSKMLLKIHTALTQTDLLLSESTDDEARERVLRVIIVASRLRSFEQDVQAVWDRFVIAKGLGLLVAELNDLFID